MKPENEVTMEFISRSCNEAFSRAAVGAFIAAMDPTLEELSDIKTAVSEAVTNCIVHAYPENPGEDPAFLPDLPGAKAGNHSAGSGGWDHGCKSGP